MATTHAMPTSKSASQPPLISVSNRVHVDTLRYRTPVCEGALSEMTRRVDYLYTHSNYEGTAWKTYERIIRDRDCVGSLDLLLLEPTIWLNFGQ